MYYCKDLYLLSVLSLYEGELLGKVNKLYFDKKLKKLLTIELVGEDGAKLLLQTKNIYNVGKNAITVKNNQAIKMKDENLALCVDPIGSKAYSIKGEFLGVVTEISLNNNFLTQKISMDNGNVYLANEVASCGKNTIILNKDGAKIKLSNFIPNKKPKDYKEVNVAVVETLPVKEVQNEALEKEKNMQTSDFLIGRVCVKDIFNFNNELLIKAHGVVTKKNLNEINKFGKLKELMLYLK